MRITFLILIFLTLFLIISLFLFRTKPSNLLSQLPEQIDGWTISESDKIYTPENLYDYIDGGAELYLSYGFRKAYCRVYSAENEPEIYLDIFDMGNSENAYGVFSHTREVESHDFGMDSQYTSGLLLFWKGKYYVSILASPETEKSREMIKLLAKKVELLIPEEGKRPELINYLPQDSLLKASIRYFKHYVWLNSFIFISNENILNINGDEEAVLAKYNSSTGKNILLLIKYQNEKSLARAKQKFMVNYAPELKHSEAVLKEEGWLSVGEWENLLAIVLKAREKSEAVDLRNRAIEHIKSLNNKIEEAK